jgi:POT family proton-dependent oligopeptide transporter
LLVAFTIGSVLYAFIFAYRYGSATENKSLVDCVLLIIITIAFWSIFEQMGSSVNLFAQRFVDRSAGPYAIPASSLLAVESLFVISLAPLVAAVWLWLSRIKRHPGVFLQFAVSFFLMGVAFIVLAFPMKFLPNGNFVNLRWLIAFYFFMSAGELCLVPVSQSVITRLAPKRLVSVLLGLLFLAHALGNIFAAHIAGRTAAGRVAARIDGYGSVYFALGAVAVSTALVVALISRMYNREWTK